MILLYFQGRGKDLIPIAATLPSVITWSRCDEGARSPYSSLDPSQTIVVAWWSFLNGRGEWLEACQCYFRTGSDFVMHIGQFDASWAEPFQCQHWVVFCCQDGLDPGLRRLMADPTHTIAITVELSVATKTGRTRRLANKTINERMRSG